MCFPCLKRKNERKKKKNKGLEWETVILLLLTVALNVCVRLEIDGIFLYYRLAFTYCAAERHILKLFKMSKTYKNDNVYIVLAIWLLIYLQTHTHTYERENEREKKRVSLKFHSSNHKISNHSQQHDCNAEYHGCGPNVCWDLWYITFSSIFGGGGRCRW